MTPDDRSSGEAGAATPGDDSSREGSSNEQLSDERSPRAVASAVDAYLAAKATGGGAGNYRALSESVLPRWADWLADRGVETLAGVTDQEMRRYAQRLRDRARDGGIAASTARTYYDVVRACLSWCVEDGLLDANPAARRRATEALPTDDGADVQQFWSPDDVRAIVSHVDRRAKAAVDERGLDAGRELRDRALVSLLAGAGVRGAEVFRDPDDDRDGRQGLRWERVDLDEGTLRVLGKSQEWEYAGVPPRAREHLRRHRRVQDPPTDDWPVFPTAHAPTLRRAARRGLADLGFDDGEVEPLLADRGVGAVLREHEIPPPAITTAGARSLLRRLCEDAGVEVDGDYLKPHGARRGLGDALYRESAELAQDALRHSSVETTHDAYSHVEAGETADRVGDVLEEAWSRNRTRDSERGDDETEQREEE